MTEDSINALAQEILDRPRMWALTKEGLLAQLSILLDVLDKPGRELYSLVTVGSACVGLEDHYEDEFVHKVRALFAVLKERT